MPLADAVGPPVQIGVAVRASVEVIMVKAVEPHVNRCRGDSQECLGVARRIASGRYALAVDALALATTLTSSWSQLSSVVRSGKPLVVEAANYSIVIMERLHLG